MEPACSKSSRHYKGVMRKLPVIHVIHRQYITFSMGWLRRGSGLALTHVKYGSFVPIF
jgi:hypothetical protein